MSNEHLKPLRVRVHLNLAKPERGENAVRIKSPTSGKWVTVGYATQLLLENCTPAVDLEAQDKIRAGSTRKIPHAFIEGDLCHFLGRLRAKAPQHLADIAAPYLHAQPNAIFAHRLEMANNEKNAINYNPRFARCFYRDEGDKASIVDRFEQSQCMAIVGWQFWAQGAHFSPMSPADRCEPLALEKTKLSETLAIRRGRAATQCLLQGVEQEGSRPTPRVARVR